MVAARGPALPRTALVLGGASDIALATVRHLAGHGLEQVVLAARDTEALARRLDDEPLGIQPTLLRWDANDAPAHAALLADARTLVGPIDLVLCAVGSLGHHSGVTMDVEAADALLRANFVGPATALLEATRALMAQGQGTIVVLSSVAGARARRSNFVYGSAKSGIDAFAQGLGDSVAGSDVRVHVVRPGFVTTKMTAGLAPAPFASTPDQVADAIVRVLGSPRSRIVWVPSLLGPLMGVLRNVPSPLWRRVAGDR